MELKVVGACGQKFKLDVETVGGRMPFTVNCPVCQADGTAAANTFKAFFLLFLLHKVNLFSLAAAAGLAFKLSTNA